MSITRKTDIRDLGLKSPLHTREANKVNCSHSGSFYKTNIEYQGKLDWEIQF